MMSQDASAPRRLALSDFAPAQVEAWISTAGAGPEAAAAPSSPAEPEEWLVAYTNPRCEDEVRAALERRALDAYVPAMTVTRRRVDVRRPVFPRYVFVGMSTDQGTHRLAGTPGLFGLVRCDGAPVKVAPAIVQGLRADEAGGLFDFTATRARASAAHAELWRVAEIQPGRKVRMVGGTWAQFGGKVLALMSGGRALVEVTLFARPMAVPIPLAYLRVAA